MSHGASSSAGSREAALAALALAVVEQATTFVGICDAQLRPCFLNAAGRAMVGLSADAAIADYPTADFFIPEHRTIIESVALPTVQRDGRWEGELCFRHFIDPGRETEVRWSAFALHDANGALIGAATLTTDISARKRAERALRDQRLLLASLLENLPLGVGVYDRHGDLIHSNQRLRDYVGLTRLPSELPSSSRRWHGYTPGGAPIPPHDYPGARALRGESVMPGVDFRYEAQGAPARWMRVSAVPFRREEEEADEAVVVVQDIDDLKRATERIEQAGAVLARQSRFLEATLSSIPDFVYAFDRQRRIAYANAAVLRLFGRPAAAMLGKTFAELDFPPELAGRLDGHIDRIIADGATIADEVFFSSPTGHSAWFDLAWGPVRADDGSVELVVGVSRDTSERRAFEEALRTSEARLRAASELVGLGVYSWDPATGALDWDARLRTMWGLPPDAAVDIDVYQAGIHPDDLPKVRAAIAACVDPAGDGRYDIEYRVLGRDDRVTRHIATSGRTTFRDGRAVGFIGAAIDVTQQRRAEAAIRASEAQFRSFAAHSSNLIWIADSVAGTILYRSAAFERIWGIPVEHAPAEVAAWLDGVHPDDRQQVEQALASVGAGEVVQFEYRIVRPSDGAIRRLRDTSFPIPDDTGAVTRIGGIAEDLTREDIRQVYIVGARPAEGRRLAGIVRARAQGAGVRDRRDLPRHGAGALAGLRACRSAQGEGRGPGDPARAEARSVTLPTIALDAPGADVDTAVTAMKAGAVDYVILDVGPAPGGRLASAIAECHGAVRPITRDENAGARVARLTVREREVLTGLVDGGTNKTIAQKLGISPRTVELHRAQVMNRLNASNLTELLQIAMAAGLAPPSLPGGKRATLT